MGLSLRRCRRAAHPESHNPDAISLAGIGAQAHPEALRCLPSQLGLAEGDSVQH